MSILKLVFSLSMISLVTSCAHRKTAIEQSQAEALVSASTGRIAIEAQKLVTTEVLTFRVDSSRSRGRVDLTLNPKGPTWLQALWSACSLSGEVNAPPPEGGGFKLVV